MTPEQIAANLVEKYSIAGFDGFEQAITTALREARVQALEEVWPLLDEAYASGQSCGSGGAYWASHMSDEWRAKYKALKHKDGQP